MMMYYLYWLIYAFFGWIIETTYVSVPQKRFVHRGFLYGPIIPIYGFGALSILLILMPYSKHPLFIFILGVLLTSFLEYVTSYVMEKIFNMRWWDYSERKFNLNGRVCLRNSILFGLLSLALVEFIHPNIQNIVVSYSPKQLYQFSKISFLMVFIDFIFSTINVMDFTENLEKISNLYEDLQIWMNENTSLKDWEKQVEDFDFKVNQNLKEMESRFHKKRQKIERKHRRLLRSFPNIRSKNFDEILKQLKKK